MTPWVYARSYRSTVLLLNIGTAGNTGSKGELGSSGSTGTSGATNHVVTEPVVSVTVQVVTIVVHVLASLPVITLFPVFVSPVVTSLPPADHVGAVPQRLSYGVDE